jgi:hypothetical protein
VSDLRRRRCQEGGGNCIMRSCIICTVHQIFINVKSRAVKWARDVARMGKMSVNLNGRNHFEDLGVYGRIILKWLLEEQGWRMRTALI